MDEVAKLLSEINWFVSIVGALFLSILGNLLTGPVQNRLAKFSVDRSHRRVAELEAQLAEIEGFRRTPSDLYLYVISVAGRVLCITLFAFALSDMTFASLNAAGSLGLAKRYGEIVYSIPQLLAALLYIAGVNYTLRMLRVVDRVRSHGEFKANVQKSIGLLNKTISAPS